LAVGTACRYDFTDGDLAVSLTQMQEYLNHHEAIPFKVLQFLFTEINYGGRVTDGNDRRLINNLVLNFCNESVLVDGYAYSPSATYCTTCASPVHSHA
jgi:dynein heavy chain, axonemal